MNLMLDAMILAATFSPASLLAGCYPHNYVGASIIFRILTKL
jgi:hypothetical protein